MWHKIKDYFKEHSRTEKKKLKEMTLKEKIGYIWEYYRMHIIGAVIVVIVAGSIINGIMNPPVPAYAGVAFYEIYLGENFEDILSRMMNEALVEDTELEQVYVHSFLSGGDPSAEMALAQKLMAMLVVNELDLIVAELEMIENFITEDIFMPLAEAGFDVPEALAVYGVSNENPERLAYAVNLGESVLRDHFRINTEALAIGIAVTTTRLDNAVAALGFLTIE